MIRHAGVITLTLVIILTFLVLTGRVHAASTQNQTTPSSSLPPANLQERLNQIRRLSKEAGLPQPNSTEAIQEDVCLTEGCLDAALDLLNAINGSVNPCDDFYQFSCGRFIANNPIPPTTYSSSYWTRAIGRVNNITQGILNEEDNPDDILPITQVKKYFKDCMNLTAVEQAGLEPLRQVINELGKWPLLNPQEWNGSAFDWLSLVAATRVKSSQSILLNIYVQPDINNTTRRVIFLDQPSLGLPRDMLITPENYTTIISAYENYIVEVATELNSTLTKEELRKEAKAIIEFESKLAHITSSDVERYNLSHYKPYQLRAYQIELDAVDEGGQFTIHWKHILDEIFAPAGVIIDEDEPVIVNEVEYFKQLVLILKEENKKQVTLANYIIWRVVSGLVEETTEAMRNISFRFQQAITGAAQPSPRVTTCTTQAKRYFGMAISTKYVEKAFDKNTKVEIGWMVKNLREAFNFMILEADWMQEVTKQAVIYKAVAIQSLLVYPDWIEDSEAMENNYENLTLGNGHFENMKKLVEYWQAVGSNLRSETERGIWNLHPVDIDAMFNYQFNTITFPAALFDTPYFGGYRPKHQNYGAVGAVIGHEITHGFDNRGAQYDKSGNARDWWDPQTKAEFENRVKCMSDQYSGYFVERAQMHINGEFTLPENIADNGGLRQSFRAYQKYVEEVGPELKLPGLEHLSTEQLFFIGFAQIFCGNMTTEGLTYQLLQDSHSPSEFRVNGAIRNSDDFASVYNCPADSWMNPPAEERCTVW